MHNARTGFASYIKALISAQMLISHVPILSMHHCLSLL